MSLIPAIEISERLFKLNTKFMTKPFAEKVYWVRENKSAYADGTREGILSKYKDFAREYAMLACDMHLEKYALEMLSDIVEPVFAYTLFHIVSDSIKALEKQGESVGYSSPESDEDCFDKFAFFSID